MIRNKELRYYLLVSIVAIAVATVVLLIFSDFIYAIVVALLGGLLIALFLYYTKKRYDDMSELSHYIRRMMEGNYNIDVRSNEEGELSILKNELFKITARLNEQHDYVAQDRIRMAEALADISHQLKTPLTSIQMMVDILEDEQLPEHRRKQFMGHIQSQLARMDWLVKVLLKLSKLDSGTVVFRKEAQTLPDVVTASIHTIQLTVIEKQITLIRPDDLASGPTIVADEKWIYEAVTNILKNAVEHTPEQGIITISWDENPIMASLTIHNSGEPIAKEELPHLFKRFFKGKQASDTSVGIGLSLSLQIMESHNGTIEVISELAKGTSFILKWYKGK